MSCKHVPWDIIAMGVVVLISFAICFFVSPFYPR